MILDILLAAESNDGSTGYFEAGMESDVEYEETASDTEKFIRSILDEILEEIGPEGTFNSLFMPR